ncbi:MAG TPA: family 20 glycosylhydrolase [Fervidobacterium sp.]|nr:family 20 glycosylhydrolase [Fervidobacterium sp.]
MDMPLLLPQPKCIDILDGSTRIPSHAIIFAKKYEFGKRFKSILNEAIHDNVNLDITTYNNGDEFFQLIINPDVVPQPQGYRIYVGDSVLLIAHDEPGLFYACATFRQLITQYGRTLPRLYIDDFPDFPNRSILMDVSRDRIPKMETLKKVIDTLAQLKINQIQLYIEHTFAYRGHEKVWKDYSPFTGEEILDIDAYCAERYIEFVPNQNTFGHLDKWLIYDEYRQLAEAPNGFDSPWGGWTPFPFSLSPVDERSIEFVGKLLDELLPHFKSNIVNIGCDETIDLGQGRSKELCERYGGGKVYFDFLMKVYNLAKHHKDTVMFWGDIIENYPQFIPQLPKDMIAMVWGYEADHPYEEKCRLYAASGNSFYVCPGTSTWNAFIGRSNNAMENITNAVVNGKRYGAIGVLTTDWGDNGHAQHIPFSWIGFGYGAHLSWNAMRLPKEQFLQALDMHVFHTDQPIAEYIYALGNVHEKLLYTPNGTPQFYAFLYPDGAKQYKEGIDMGQVEDCIEEVNGIAVQIKTLAHFDALTDVVEQVLNNVDFALLGLKVISFILKYDDIRNVPDKEWVEFEKQLDSVLDAYKNIWLKYNRPGGLEQSIHILSRIKRIRKGESE